MSCDETTWTLFRGNVYKVDPNLRSFADAETNCLLCGGHLASVTTLEEHDLVSTNGPDRMSDLCL